MQPAPPIEVYNDRISLATHKFNQRKIMAKAARRRLVVQYFEGQWTFIDPFNMEPFVQFLNDDAAISWLDSVARDKVSGTVG